VHGQKQERAEHDLVGQALGHEVAAAVAGAHRDLVRDQVVVRAVRAQFGIAEGPEQVILQLAGLLGEREPGVQLVRSDHRSPLTNS
jgi:hypothetical protein